MVYEPNVIKQTDKTCFYHSNCVIASLGFHIQYHANNCSDSDIQFSVYAFNIPTIKSINVQTNVQQPVIILCLACLKFKRAYTHTSMRNNCKTDRKEAKSNG